MNTNVFIVCSENNRRSDLTGYLEVHSINQLQVYLNVIDLCFFSKAKHDLSESSNLRQTKIILHGPTIL